MRTHRRIHIKRGIIRKQYEESDNERGGYGSDFIRNQEKKKTHMKKVAKSGADTVSANAITAGPQLTTNSCALIIPDMKYTHDNTFTFFAFGFTEFTA